MVNKHIWNDLHKHDNGHHVPHTFTPPGTRSVLPAEFLPIRGHGAIAIVMRENGKRCCGLSIHHRVGGGKYAEPVVWVCSSVCFGGGA